MLVAGHGAPRAAGAPPATSGVEEFEEIYQQPLADMTTDFFATADPTYLALYHYPAPTFEAQGAARWSSALDFSCERDDVRGTEEGREAIRELTIPTTGFYAFWTSTGGPIRVRAMSVTSGQNSGELFSIALELPPNVIAAGPLEAGDYEVVVVAPPGVETGTAMIWESLGTEPVFPGGTP